MNPITHPEFSRLLATAIQDLRASEPDAAQDPHAAWVLDRADACITTWQTHGEGEAIACYLRSMDEALRHGIPAPALLHTMSRLSDRLGDAVPSDSPAPLQAQCAAYERFARHLLATCSERLWDKQERQRLTLAAQGRELGELMRLARDSARAEHPDQLPTLVLTHVARAFGASRGIAWVCPGEGQLSCMASYRKDEGASGDCVWLPGAEAHAREAIALQRPLWVNGPEEASLHMPLLAADGAMGALSVYRDVADGTFHKRDLLLAQSLSSLAAVVLSHANLIAQSRRQAERAAHLANIAVRLSGPKNLDEILQTAADCWREMLVPDGASLVTLSERAPTPCQRMTAASFDPEQWPTLTRQRLGGCLSQEKEPFRSLARTRMPMNVDTMDKEAPELARATGGRSALFVPILDGDHLIGTLGLLSAQAGHLDLDMSLAKSLTDRITAAVLSARLLEETQRRTQEIETLYEAAQDISRQRPDISAVLDRLLHRTLAVLGADRGFVGLLQSGELVIPSQVMAPGTELPTLDGYRPRHDVFRQLTLSPGPIQIRDASELSPETYPLLAALRARTLLLIPIFLDERLIGFIVVGTARERCFDESDRHLASSLAYLGGLAVRNASYLANLEHEVTTRTHDLEEANRKLQLLDQVRRNLLANVTHELRTPLSGILGYGEILEEELGTQLSDEQRSFMHELLSEGYHLRDLINTMIDMSQLATGTLVLDRQPVSFELLARQACEHYVKLAEAKSLTFDCEVEPDLPYVDADPSRAYQVLGHLLTNALKFTPIGGRVSLRVVRDQKDHRAMVRAEVRDTGIGIPSEKLPLLFTSFFQADPSATRQFGGMGLGLSLSKHLVELHGGQIWADTTEGQGSTFAFTLPVWQESDQTPLGEELVG